MRVRDDAPSAVRGAEIAMNVFGPDSELTWPPFRQRWPWLGGDLQTLRSAFRPPAPLVEGTTESLTFTCLDGTGDVLIGTLHQPALAATKPLIVLIHGLTGSQDSSHIISSARYFLAAGHPVLRQNLRGAGPSRQTCRQTYHAGRTEDLAWVMSALPSRLTQHGVCIMAVSLGGNMLLKFLADYPAFPTLKAAVAICPPVDLKSAQVSIMRRRNRFYHRHLLQNMKSSLYNTDNNTVLHDPLAAVETVYAFDDQIVAPANGFDNAEDYYRQCSALQSLETIETRTLIIHAADDPWVPVTPIQDAAEQKRIGAKVSVVIPDHGGHVGFHGQGTKTPWHNACAAQFFDHATSG
jgi:uncharacterized protein